jgi:preprotein translocase subunit SecF
MKLLKLVPDHTNIDFMRWRNIAVILSTVLTIASLAYTAYRGLNLGIDFVGGQVVRVEFTQPVHIEDLRARVARLEVGEASIQALGNDRTYQVRLPKPLGPETASNQIVSKLRTALPQAFPGARVDAGESVSGKVSEELAADGAKAIIFAMIGIALYIWIRFEWQFGVGALLTLAHDVSMTLGFFAFTRLQVDLNVVAAILTIVGYSLNDTVVIYDRIRENLRKYRKMAILPLLNLSLNETLSRTIVTSLSILLALGMLLLLGPEVIFGLTIAIFIGIFVGTYSSVYISSPVLVWLGVKPDTFVRAEDEKAPGPAAV